MILKGNNLRERFSEQLQQIEMLSRNFAVFLSEEGLEESSAEEFMNLFASDSNLNEHENSYKDMLSVNIGIEYFKAVNDISNYQSLADVYAEYAMIAWEKKIPVNEFVKILDEKELYEIEDDLDQYESAKEPEEEQTKAHPDEKQEETDAVDAAKQVSEHEDNVAKLEKKNKEKKPDVEVIQDYKPRMEKNFFTQTIEDLLGASIESLETEEEDGNLDSLVKSITDAILEDKRKTNLINNLRKIVTLANKQMIRMNNRINNCANVENELRNQIYNVTQERDEYKRKFEELNAKINELTSITSFSNFGGIKQIE